MNPPDCEPTKPRLVLQARILNIWISIFSEYNQEQLERIANELNQLSEFRIIEQSWTPEGVVTEKEIRRWMPSEQ